MTKRNMFAFGALTCFAAMMCSCAEKYRINGSSIQSLMDGNVVLLTKANNGVRETIDSCEVLHGNFKMTGCVDSVSCVTLDMGNFHLPIVLEPGDIKVTSSDMSITVEGTPLNDKLYSFLNSRDSLIMLLAELPRKESRLILEGENHDMILRMLEDERAELRMSMDKLETQFITDNYDNVLGVSWFLQLCNDAFQRYGYATTTPQIDEVYWKAPESFKNNPEVAKYMEQCK